MRVNDHESSAKTLLVRLLPAILTIFVLLIADLSIDIVEKTSTQHLIIEALIYVVMLYIALVAFFIYKSSRSSLKNAQDSLSESNNKLRYWQEQNKSLIEGLSQKIHEEFIKWGLSKAEREVAILIIKGFSLSEIGELRGTSERTIRDQATAVYQKANIKNRIELSAYFLEDMLTPLSSPD